MIAQTNITSHNQAGGTTAKNVNSYEVNIDNRKLIIWKSRGEGFLIGSIISFLVNIVSSYIFAFLSGK